MASRLVTEQADAADFIPALTSATADHPDAVVLVFPAASCQRILHAAAGLGATVPLVVPGACATPAVLSASGRAQILAVSSFTTVPDSGGSPDEQAYRDRLAPDDRGPLSQAAFATVLVIGRLLVESGPAPSSAGVARLLAESREHPNVMAHAFTCNHEQLPIHLPSVCNPFVRVLTEQAGQLSDATGGWLNAGPIAKLMNP